MADAVWWKKGIIYQIYPRSFQDSNGDGTGDLNGIVSRLDYLTDLGVDAIWISPVYPSPMVDLGYDVANYCDIDARFGSLNDFNRLVQQAHHLGLKIILDFVPNHTSDTHVWFRESRTSRSSAKRDWYLWRDPKPDGGPPNNWVSQFGGSAWTFDSLTGQYYLHSFLPEQPDLNWRNQDVRAAMLEVLRFWLDRGVDGFRVDVIWLLIKDDKFRDNPPNPAYTPTQPDINRTLSVFNSDRPEIHAIVAEMRALLDQYPDRVLIGEIYLPFERLVSYYGKDNSGAQLPFNFALIHAAWNAKTIAELIRSYERALPPHGWPTWVLGNHDQSRIASRVGDEQARIAAMLLLTLRGTPTMYYGDEIGLPCVEVPPRLVRDPWEKREPGLGVGRDPSRTPMQWDSSANAGFSRGSPWLPLELRYQDRNVAALDKDPRSILSLYRALISIRKRYQALSLGTATVMSDDNNVLIYERTMSDQRIVVVLNFSSENRPLSVLGLADYHLLLSTHQDRAESQSPVDLRSNEGVIFALK